MVCLSTDRQTGKKQRSYCVLFISIHDNYCDCKKYITTNSLQTLNMQFLFLLFVLGQLTFPVIVYTGTFYKKQVNSSQSSANQSQASVSRLTFIKFPTCSNTLAAGRNRKNQHSQKNINNLLVHVNFT